MAKLTLGKTVASVLIASTLALSVAVGITVGQAYKPNNESGQNGDGGNQDNPFENVETKKVEKTGSYGLIDEYTIEFDDGTESRFIVVKNSDGKYDFQAFPNNEGHTPTVALGENGNWIINEKDTGLLAEITNVIDNYGPYIGDNGNWWIGDTDTGSIAQGENGLTPHIGDNGNWWIGDTDTGVPAQGQAGANGKSAYELACEQGYTGSVDEWLLTLVGNNGKSAYEVMQEQGYTGTLEEWIESLRGQNGVTPHIGDNGNWFIGEQDTGIAAQGQAGENGQNGQNGVTPHIGDNGNWFIGEQDTGVQAQGQDGKSAFEVMQEQGYTGTLEEWLDSLVGQDGQNGKSAYDIYCDVHEGDDLSEAEWLASLAGAAGNGISSITGPVADGLFDTYTINYTNGTQSQFVVKNGQDGKDGTVTLFGTSEPDDAQGVNGDSYINTQTWDYYVKENNAWAQKGNIKGATGANGKSAYEIMQEAGYTGSITEWLESLKGEKGDDGENGKSAYELAKDQGYTGTLQEWLDSLVGQDGDDGKSAYELYCDNHDDPDLSEQEWLASLAGANGQNGKSAYEIYCDLNADPDLSEAEWLASLVGQNGQNGKSIYAANGEPDANLGNVGDSYVNVNNGDYYVKEDAGWGTPIGSLKGATGAAGNGIASIELTDDTNATKSVYTITYTDATTDTLEIAKPRSIVSIVRTSGDGSAGTTDTYTITYNYGDADTFTVTHGSNGNTILTGDTAPSDSIGRPGDVYVDYVNQDIYLRGIDDWSVGISFRGEDGRGIASIDKSGPEADGLTYTYTITYTDASTPFVFTVTNGADGADGTKVVTGAELPTVLTNFQEGDAFISTTNWNYYVLQDNAGELEWDYRGNIRGTGLYTGHIGDNVPDVEETYKAGDSYLNLDNWNYYVLLDNAGTLEWHLEGNIHNSPNQYTVTFVSNQGTEVDPIDDALEGHTITRPADPTRNEYYFQGWYTVEGNKWDFTKDVVMDDITLYARWAQFQVVDGVLVGCSASGDIVVPQFFDGQDVVAIGETAFKNKTDITSVILPQTITAIQESSFEDCTGLLSVSVPKTVRSIGENAFKGCINLAYVYLEEGLLTIGDSAFENCESLVALAIPNSVSSIGESTFENCETLTAVVVPDSVASIGASAFAGCNNLVSITVPYVGGSANGTDDQFFAYIFGGVDADTGYDSVPDSLLNVALTGANGDNRDQLQTKSFYGCSHIEHINLSENITVVGNSAFENCSGLKALEFPLSVTNFGTNVLKGATAIEELKVPFIGDAMTNTTKYFGYFFGGTSYSNNSTYVPESLKTLEVTGDFKIGYNVLEGCSHIENLIISGTPTEFNNNAFKGCSSIQYLYLSYLGSTPTSSNFSLRSLFNSDIPSTINTIIIANGTGANHDELSSSAFKGCPNIENIVLPKGLKTINNEAFYQSKIKNIVIPEGVTTIGNRVFYYSEAESIVISDSVTSIGTECFYQCPKLTYVKIGNGVTSIPQRSCYQCSKLFEVVLGNSVTSIGDNAFYNCENLASINFPNGLTSIGTYAFYHTNLSTVILPESVETLGSNVFANIGALYYVDLQKCKELEEIPSAAFIGCSALYYVRLQNRYVDYNLTKTFVIGESAFRSCSSLRIVAGLEHAHSIEQYAFMSCISLESIEVGYTSNSNTGATTIKQYAFWECSGLTYVKFNTSNKYPLSIQAYAFRNCTSLKAIDLGSQRQNSIGTIAKNAFYECTGVESVRLPYLGSSPTDPYKFSELLPYGSSNVKTVEICDSINIIDEAFYGCNSMTSCRINHYGTTATNFDSFGNRVFGSCGNLKTFYIDYAVTTIGTELFIDCTSLIEVTLRSSFTSIPNGCFKNCSSLVKFEGANNVKSIGFEAFYGCSSLKRIDDSSYSANGFNKLEQIGNNAFYNCVSLSTVVLKKTVNSIGNHAFYGCESLESISIPGENATTIGDYAFSNCSNLAYIELKDGVSSVGQYAFQNCTSLKALIVPNSITTIGNDFLYHCDNLESLVIPNLSNKHIGDFFSGFYSGVNHVPDSLKVVVIKGDAPIIEFAFGGCAKIETIRFDGNPSSIANNAFQDCTSLKTLAVPYIGLNSTGIGTLYADSGNPNDPIYSWPATGIASGATLEVHVINDYPWNVYDYDDPDLYEGYVVYYEDENMLVYAHDYDGWEWPDVIDYWSDENDDYWWYVGSYKTDIPYTEYYSFKIGHGHPTANGIVPSSGYAYFDIDTLTFYFPTAEGRPGSENDLFVSTNSGWIYRYVDGTWVKEQGINMGTLSVLTGNTDPDNSQGSDGDYFVNLDTYDYFKKVSGSWGYADNFKKSHARFGYWFDGYKNEYGIPESLKTVEITGDMTEIGNDLFRNCAYIEQVILPNTVVTIGESAFQNCSSLQSIAFPGSASTHLTIGESAFQNCSSLQSIAFPGSASTHLTIGMRAFFNCTALKTVDFDKVMTVDSLGYFAFSGCSKLNEFNPNNALIKEVEQNAFKDCVSLKTIKFKEGLTRLSHYAFMDCTGLMNVVLPEGLDTINSYTFSGCTSLTNIVIPSTVTVIDNNAFEQCVSLTGTLNLKNVTTIRESAFEGCTNISTVIIDVSKLTTLQDNAFKGCDGITTVVVYGSSGADLGAKLTAYEAWFGHNNISSTGNEAIAYISAGSGNATSGARFIFR